MKLNKNLKTGKQLPSNKLTILNGHELSDDEGVSLIKGYVHGAPLRFKGNDTFFDYASFSIGREKFLNSQVSGNAAGFASRVRVDLGEIHLLRDGLTNVYSLEDINLSHPLCLKVLANTKSRKEVEDFISSAANLRRFVQLVTGPSQRLKVGVSKRYSFMDVFTLVNELKPVVHHSYNKENNKEKEKVSNGGESSLTFSLNPSYHINFTIARFLWDALVPFDAWYNTLQLKFITSSSYQVLTLDDLESLVKEGEVKRILGDMGISWLDKRTLPAIKERDEVYTSVILESLSSSVLNFKSTLGKLSLFDLRYQAAVQTARMACAYRLGIKTSFADLAVGVSALEDGNIRTISNWFCIVNSVLDGALIETEDLSNLYDHGLSVESISYHASKMIEGLEAHPLVLRLTPGEFVKSLNVEHMHAYASGYHVLTSINRVYDELEESLAVSEFSADTGIYRPVVNNLTQKIISTLKRPLASNTSLLSQIASLGEMNIIMRDLEVASSSACILNEGSVGVVLSGLDNLTLRILNLMSYDLSIGYEYSELENNLQAGIKVTNWAYVINDKKLSLLTALTLVDGALYTSSDIVAGFFLDEKKGSIGSSMLPIDKFDAKLLDSDFINSVTTVDTVYALQREAGGSVNISSDQSPVNAVYKVDLGNLLLLPSTLETYMLGSVANRNRVLLLESFIHRVCDIAEDKASLFKNGVAQSDLESSLAALVNTLHDSYADVYVFNAVRRLAHDSAARSISKDVRVWANWMHNFRLRGNLTLFAIRVCLQLIGVDRDACNRMIKTLKESTHALAFVESTLSQRDKWTTLEQKEL